LKWGGGLVKGECRLYSLCFSSITHPPTHPMLHTPNHNHRNKQSKKDQMIARARTAKTTQKVNDMLSSVTGTTSMDAFERMKEKVGMYVRTDVHIWGWG
jgi:hypothetical protein